MKMRGDPWPFVLAVVGALTLSLSYGQSLVKADQGKPGNQGPWPVTGTIVVVPGFDGGTPEAVTDVICNAVLPDAGSPQQVTSVGVSATPVPVIPAATRYYITVCNSSENTGTPLVKCLYNNVSPVMGIANNGDVLGVSDCWKYPITGTNQLKCISDTASTAVTSNECVP